MTRAIPRRAALALAAVTALAAPLAALPMVTHGKLRLLGVS